MPQLIQECDQAEAPEFTEDLKIYREVRDNIYYEFKSGTSNWTVPDDVTDLTDERNYDYNEPSEEDEYFEPEVRQRRVQSRSYMKFAKNLRKIIAPFTITGMLDVDGLYYDPKIFKNSTLRSPNIEELLADATLSAFGKGFETVVDTNAPLL